MAFLSLQLSAMYKSPPISRMITLLAVVLIQGCSSAQLISPQSVEDRVAQVKLGVTTMSQVEAIFGAPQGAENQRWYYNLSDTAFEITERKTGRLSGVLPFAPATVATNTRAFITVRFAESQKVSALEVARFFDPPYHNDYWYMLKPGAVNVFDSIKRAAEASELRIENLNLSARTFALEDGATQARMVVKLDDQMLHIATRNPHDRLTSDYRVFTKRESAFTSKIAAADFLY